jgi:hypothetical protein
LGPSIRANDEEQSRRLAGDELLNDALASITHAVTIRASRQAVWPWLAQMGAGRAGWYSYDIVDNGGQPSASRIVPEFQHLQVGMLFPALPGAEDAFVLLQYEHERSLVLGWVMEPAGVLVTSWELALEELAPSQTRLVERVRVGSPYRPYGIPEWLALPLARVAHWVMVRKHLLGIARRVEILSVPGR